MGDLNLISLIVRGIKSDMKKRRQIFEHFSKKVNSFVFLQETHSTTEIEKKWKDEWGAEIIFAHGIQ
jgi:hypothetical protein